MSTKAITNWRVRRAGAGMTVYGFDADTKAAIRITKVDEIVPGVEFCLAKASDGVHHQLLLR